jgi:hypothetical protein
MKRISLIISVLLIFGFCLVVCTGCSSTPNGQANNLQSGRIMAYFPTTPGWRLAYDFKSQLNPNDNGGRRIIFQNPGQANTLSFQFTKVDAGEFANCIWKSDTEIIGASNNLDNTYNDGGFRYFYLINMPAQYKNGMNYTAVNVKYHLTTGETWKDYHDCIKISFESPEGFGPPWEQAKLGGTGYFYLANAVGLVYLHFENRTTHNIETFTLSEAPKQLAMHRIYGHIQDGAGNPLPDFYVSLDPWLGRNWYGKTDATGDYSFPFYYEASKVYNRGIVVGKDANSNNILDNDEIAIATNYINFTDEDLDWGTWTIK